VIYHHPSVFVSHFASHSVVHEQKWVYVFVCVLRQCPHKYLLEPKTKHTNVTMKLPGIAVYVLAVIPGSSLAEAPPSLRRLPSGPFRGGINGGNGQQHGGGFLFDFDRANVEQELVAIECAADNSCETRDGEVGTWACRSLTHPVTGETLSRALCIPNDRAWPTGRFKETPPGVSPLFKLSHTLCLLPL
jgi:hypothetical protein